MRQRIPWLMLTLLLVCIGSTALWAADPVGVLVVEQGLVKVRRGQAEQVHRASPAQVPVFVGDEVQSAKETRARLLFRRNDEVINLYSSTFFRVEDVRPARSFFVLSIGKAIFAVARQVSQQAFEVRTPTATIGVKGTEFVVGTDGGEKTFLLTVTGVVAMASLDFPDREVLVGRDQASFATKGKLPTPPTVVTPEIRETIKREDGLKTMITIEAQAPPPPPAPSGPKKDEKKDEQPKQEQEPSEGTSDSPPPSATTVVDAVQQVQQTVSTSTETTATSTAEQLQIDILRGGSGALPGSSPPPVGVTITR